MGSGHDEENVGMSMEEGEGPPRSTLAFVDRLEGAWAVLTLGASDQPAQREPAEDPGRIASSAPFDVPRELLPPGTREGDALWLRVSRDPERTRQAQGRTQALQAHLLADDDGGDISL